ncbi:hypothetical protein [Streptomyces sp. NPDC002187]|uniref:hypothetical protein n=1 Tax=Streptomyces sp. NPDC002187 TaxID=3364637 RepID=UPI0036BAA1B0
MSAAADTTVARAGAAARPGTAEQAGRRVEEVLEQLAASGDERTCAAAEELVRVLMDFYGTGLARTVELLRRHAHQGPGADPLAALLGDELVASLLVLHDLHPEDLTTRIGRAMDTVRGLGVEQAGFDEATGVLRLRTTGSGGCGCPSTQDGARQAAEDALACFAPEVAGVDMDGTGTAREPALLQIGTRPAGPSPVGSCSATAR